MLKNKITDRLSSAEAILNRSNSLLYSLHIGLRKPVLCMCIYHTFCVFGGVNVSTEVSGCQTIYIE